MPLLIGALPFLIGEVYRWKYILSSLLLYLFSGTVVLQEERPAKGAFRAYDEYKTSLSF
jgi:hypothetical protein